MIPSSISVIITTNNEADNIRRVLQSVQWVREVIVVDSFSTDQTVAIAKSMGATVLQQVYQGPAKQKNWAIPKAKFEWVLILDADERVTSGLKKEILQIIDTPVSKDAYWIKRQNFFMGQRVNYSGWQGDKVIRLIRRDKCRYNDLQVHEEIETKGIEVGILKNKLEHYTYKNLEHYLAKLRRYALWSAQDHLVKTPKVTVFHLVLKPIFRFLKHYIFKLGILDGRTGFVISMLMAWSVFLRYLKIQELHTLKKDKTFKA